MKVSMRFGTPPPLLGDGHPFQRVHVDDPEGAQLLSLCLRSLLFQRRAPQQPLVIVCVGTDRSTGDAFGPLVGSRLTALGAPGAEIMGTLDHPVHATNLEEVLRELEKRPRKPLVIAVDACLGKAESVGIISVRNRPLEPGSGVHKNLPPIGDFHVVGIVNVGGFMEYFVLQSTRLSLVMRMAEMVAHGFHQALLWERAGGESLLESQPAPTRE